MAVRRGISRAFQSASSSVGDLIKRMLDEESDMRRAAYVGQRQQELENLQHRNQLGRLMVTNPDAVDRYMSSGDSEYQDVVKPWGRTQGQRTAEAAAPILAAQDRESLPGDTGVGILADRFGARPDIAKLMAARAEREAGFQAADVRAGEASPHIIPGTTQTGFKRGGQTFMTNLSPEDQAGRERTIKLGTEFHPDVVRAGIDKENQTLRGTRDEVGRSAYREANQREGGSLDARISRKDGLVDLETALAEGRSQASGGSDAMVAPLLAAAQQAEEYEKQGARAAFFAQQRAKSPSMAAALAAIKNVPGTGWMQPTPVDMNYVNSALNYSTQLTKLMSGVQAREDERDIFFANNFVFGDEDPKTVEAKQRSRRIFTSAVIASQGAGGRVAAGRVLGQAIASGNLPASALAGYPLDPEFEAGVREGLGLGVR